MHAMGKIFRRNFASITKIRDQIYFEKQSKKFFLQIIRSTYLIIAAAEIFGNAWLILWNFFSLLSDY